MRTAIGVVGVLVACSHSSSSPTQGSAAPSGSAVVAPDPCDAFATTMSRHVSAPDDQKAVFAIAHMHCATWPAATQQCAAVTRDDDDEGQEKCFAGVPMLDRATLRDELADAVVDCGIVDPLEAGSPDWLAAPVGIAPEAWREATSTLDNIAELQCRATPWPRTELRCLRAAKRPPHDCLGADAAALDAALAPAIDLWTRAAAAKPSTCERMAAAWYSDAAWQAHHRAGSPNAARHALAESCHKTADLWNPARRACVVLAKTDRERVYCGIGVQWGFPPLALDPKPKDICPDVELAEARGLLCDGLSADAWDREIDAIRTQRAAMASANAPSCSDSLTEVIARFARLGCKL
jgi:hypothetical protein